MTEIEIGKEKLRNAMLRYCAHYMETVELVPEEEAHISPELERKMQKLIKRQKSPFWKYFNTAGKRFAAACIAVVILCGALMSFTPVREAVSSFFVNVYDKFTEIFANKNASANVIGNKKVLTYIPEGYFFAEEKSGSYANTIIYRNDDGDEIEFEQIAFGGAFTFDTESADYGIIHSGDTEIFYSVNKGRMSFYWHDGEYQYTIVTPSAVSEDEAMKMMSSVASAKR